MTAAITAGTDPALVGLFLCGSLATGDYDEGISDIDLLAVLFVSFPVMEIPNVGDQKAHRAGEPKE